jgi:signal transduction histidine kinase
MPRDSTDRPSTFNRRVSSRLRNSLTARTLIGSAVLAAILVVAFATLVIAIGSLRQAGRTALRAQQAVTAGAELERSAIALESGLRGYVSTGADKDLQPFRTARAAYPAQVARLRVLAKDDPRLRDDVADVSELITDYIDLWALPLLDVTRENPARGKALLDYRTGAQRIARVRDALRAMFGRARTEARSSERRAESRARMAIRLGVIGIAVVVLTAAGAALMLRRRVVRPIQRVATASGALAAGDLGVRVETTRQDELGALARAFNEMATGLERQRAELAARTEDLERSNRELEDYASVASHDLQGPLVTIGMYAGLLERKLDDDPEAQALATHIRTGSERMRELVRDLLEYSRLEREAFKTEAVDLEQTVRETLDSLAGPLRDRAAEVVVRELPTVAGDPGRLRQVLQNLLANAVKFTAEGVVPRVEVVSVAESPTMARVSVHDNGIGFAAGQADDIFRPFHRLHSADRFEGTGIGLAVCQRIVEQHGGRIWAEGAPGQGATFHFTLPVSETQAERPSSLVGAGGLPT